MGHKSVGCFVKLKLKELTFLSVIGESQIQAREEYSITFLTQDLEVGQMLWSIRRWVTHCTNPRFWLTVSMSMLIDGDFAMAIAWNIKSRWVHLPISCLDPTTFRYGLLHLLRNCEWNWTLCHYHFISQVFFHHQFRSAAPGPEMIDVHQR